MGGLIPCDIFALKLLHHIIIKLYQLSNGTPCIQTVLYAVHRFRFKFQTNKVELKR